jgi:hypothetical protein
VLENVAMSASHSINVPVTSFLPPVRLRQTFSVNFTSDVRPMTASTVTRTFAAICAFLAGFGLLLPRTTQAQAYPAKPVRWIVPYAAGGSADTRARQIALELT